MTEPVENLSISDQLAQRFLTQHLGEATSYLESLSPDAAASALQSVPPESIIPVWEYLSTGFGSLVFPLLATERQIALLEGLDRSIAARIAGTMPESARNDTLARLDDGTAEQIRLLLSYPEDTAGRLMDTHVFALRGTVTAGRAVEMVRQRGRGDAISIKAVDADNRLIGLVDLRDIAFSDPEKPLSELTTGVAAVVNAMDPRSAVVEKFRSSIWTDMSSGLSAITSFWTRCAPMRRPTFRPWWAPAATSARCRPAGSRSVNACPGCRSTCSPHSSPPPSSGYSNPRSRPTQRWPSCCRWSPDSPAMPAPRRWP
jgi:hypothetical protein